MERKPENAPLAMPIKLEGQALSAALAILTAMITPALLLSACGAFILSTSQRLGRVFDRIRTISDRFEELVHQDQNHLELIPERKQLFFNQLDELILRANLLQRALTAFYITAGVFVFTSVAIGLIAFVQTEFTTRSGIVPVVLAITGAMIFFYGCVLLIREAWVAFNSLADETAFILRLARLHSEESPRGE